MFRNGNEERDMSTSEEISMYLSRPVFDKGQILYTENYCIIP